MDKKNHNINYVELPSSDVPRTKEFYSRVFGWKFTDWGPDYASFEGAGIDGGFNGTGNVSPHPPGALIVIYSSALEATEEAIKESGGKIVIPIFEFPGGRRFHFTDPCGNQLAVWSE